MVTFALRRFIPIDWMIWFDGRIASELTLKLKVKMWQFYLSCIFQASLTEPIIKTLFYGNRKKASYFSFVFSFFSLNIFSNFIDRVQFPSWCPIDIDNFSRTISSLWLSLHLLSHSSVNMYTYIHKFQHQFQFQYWIIRVNESSYINYPLENQS